jgi:hypothetical protein
LKTSRGRKKLSLEQQLFNNLDLKIPKNTILSIDSHVCLLSTQPRCSNISQRSGRRGSGRWPLVQWFPRVLGGTAKLHGPGGDYWQCRQTAIGRQRKAKPTPDGPRGFSTSYDPHLDIFSTFKSFCSASILLFQFITSITTFKIFSAASTTCRALTMRPF